MTMEEKTLIDLLNDPAKLIAKIEALRPDDGVEFLQYEPENHNVTKEQFRKKREIMKPVLDSNGQPVPIPKDQPGEGQDQLKKVYEEVARITTATQKLIVRWAVQIAAGVPVEVQAPTEMDVAQQKKYDMLVKTLRDNKMAYLDQEILRLKKIYKIVAEIWYSEDTDAKYWGKLGRTTSKKKMRLMIMSKESGDSLYPVKNDIGKMIALGRGYKTKDEDDKEVNKFDLFTDKAITTFTQVGSGWMQTGFVELKYGKANFIVHEQPKVEWADVQSKIDRLETVYSNHADQNDATGSPILVSKGKITGYASRGETGKVFEVENDGDLKFVESTGAPESVKMEVANLIKGIYDETFTPQISFSDATSLGANVPGVTMKLFFLPATLKAMNEQSGGWGMSVQRRYNFLIAAMGVINTDVVNVELEVSPRFNIFMPANDTENYANTIALVGAGLLSRKTAVEQLKLTEDSVAELAQIQKELEEAQAKLVALTKSPAPAA